MYFASLVEVFRIYIPDTKPGYNLKSKSAVNALKRLAEIIVKKWLLRHGGLVGVQGPEKFLL